MSVVPSSTSTSPAWSAPGDDLVAHRVDRARVRAPRRRATGSSPRPRPDDRDARHLLDAGAALGHARFVPADPVEQRERGRRGRRGDHRLAREREVRDRLRGPEAARVRALGREPAEERGELAALGRVRPSRPRGRARRRRAGPGAHGTPSASTAVSDGTIDATETPRGCDVAERGERGARAVEPRDLRVVLEPQRARARDHGCGTRADATMLPSASAATAFTDDVPMSIPTVTSAALAIGGAIYRRCTCQAAARGLRGPRRAGARSCTRSCRRRRRVAPPSVRPAAARLFDDRHERGDVPQRDDRVDRDVERALGDEHVLPEVAEPARAPAPVREREHAVADAVGVEPLRSCPTRTRAARRRGRRRPTRGSTRRCGTRRGPAPPTTACAARAPRRRRPPARLRTRGRAASPTPARRARSSSCRRSGR